MSDEAVGTESADPVPVDLKPLGAGLRQALERLFGERMGFCLVVYPAEREAGLECRYLTTGEGDPVALLMNLAMQLEALQEPVVEAPRLVLPDSELWH